MIVVMGKAKRKDGVGEPRAKNFNEREKEALVSGLEARMELVSREMGIGKKYKNNEDVVKAWEEIAREISAVGMGEIRTGPQTRTKWSDYKSVVKKKAQDILKKKKGTGGGPVNYDQLTPLELRVVKLIGETAIHGIAGDDNRIDTMALSKQVPRASLVSFIFKFV